MTLLVIADDESLLNSLPESKADVVISCGDLPDDIILRAAGQVRCSQILAVKGNHDGSGTFPSPIIDLHLCTHRISGITFGGFCGAWKYKPRGNYLFEQFEVDRLLTEFPQVDVFVAHNSPRMTHDRDDDVHLGFTAFVSYIQRARPRLFLHGHQHLQAESQLFNTHVVGTYGHKFIVINEKPG